MITASELKHLVFDLDDTLIDTTGLIIPIAVRETAASMIAAGLKTQVEDVVAFRETFFRRDPRADFILETTKKFGVSTTESAVIEAGQRTFYNSDERRLKLLSGSKHSREAMHFIEKAKAKFHIHIVTSGEPATQLRKIQWADLHGVSESVHCVSAHRAGAKREAFEAVMRQTLDAPATHLSVGNRLDIDIAEARALGWQTCWFRHGEYQYMIPKDRTEIADLTVTNWQELHVLL